LRRHLDHSAELAVYCPKALAGIGRLPDTVADRSIPIRLRRRGRGEKVERFRLRLLVAEAEPLAEWARSWAEQNEPALAEAWPELPAELDDRAQDGWEPLLAIADRAGGEWPARARAAALALSEAEEDEAAAIRLLADCRTVFGGRDRLATKDLIAALCEDEEAPWSTWHKGERRITARALARLLEPFGIHSRTIRLGENDTPKGYMRESFEDAWERYLPPSSPDLSATTPQPSSHAGLTRGGYGSAESYPQRPEPFTHAGCGVVADRTGNKRVCVGDEAFPELVDRAFHAGHLTEAEWLERRKLHALISEAEAEPGPDGDGGGRKEEL
jgi:hypothetical protein